MSHGAHNHNDNNSIERNDRAIDKPPPAKKQRVQLFTKYKDFVAIIDKLAKEFDPALLICITWSTEGLKCDERQMDTEIRIAI